MRARYVCLCVCLSVSLSVYQSICLHVSVGVCLSTNELNELLTSLLYSMWMDTAGIHIQQKNSREHEPRCAMY